MAATDSRPTQKCYLKFFERKCRLTKNGKRVNGKRSFQALVYYRSIPRTCCRRLNRLWPRHFFHAVAPLNLKQVDLAPPGPDWLVLKSLMCGICGSDLRLLKGVESLLLEPYALFPRYWDTRWSPK